MPCTEMSSFQHWSVSFCAVLAQAQNEAYSFTFRFVRNHTEQKIQKESYKQEIIECLCLEKNPVTHFFKSQRSGNWRPNPAKEDRNYEEAWSLSYRESFTLGHQNRLINGRQSFENSAIPLFWWTKVFVDHNIISNSICMLATKKVFLSGRFCSVWPDNNLHWEPVDQNCVLQVRISATICS